MLSYSVPFERITIFQDEIFVQYFLNTSFLWYIFLSIQKAVGYGRKALLRVPVWPVFKNMRLPTSVDKDVSIFLEEYLEARHI